MLYLRVLSGISEKSKYTVRLLQSKEASAPSEEQRTVPLGEEFRPNPFYPDILSGRSDVRKIR